jgi:ATP-binding cassette subfamily B protein
MMPEPLRRLRLVAAMSIRPDPLRSLATLTKPLDAAAQILLALWVKLLVDGVVSRDQKEAVVGAAGIVVSMLLDYGTGLLGNLARVALAERVGFAFDREIASITASIPSLEPFERADYADQLQILRQNRALLGGALNTLLNTMNTTARMVTAVVLLAAVDPRLLVLLVAAFPALISARLRYRWGQQGEDASAPAGRLARHLAGITTSPGGAVELRAYGLEGELRNRLRTANTAWRRPLVAARVRQSVATAVTNSVFALALVGVLAWLLVEASHGVVTVGTLALAVVVSGQLQGAIVGSVDQMGHAAEALRSAGRFLWLQQTAEEIKAGYLGTIPPPPTFRRGVTLEQVSYRYPGATHDSLSDISLHIPAGSVLALVGENGSGKSTLVSLLLGLHRPTAGRILVDGIDLLDINITEWRDAISAAFQDFARLELTAQHSVGVGYLPQVDNPGAVHSALLNARSADVEQALPGGLATQLGSTWPDGVDLSTGQWQKIAVGRTTMRQDPMLRVFDEPTASLDAPSEHALFSQYASAAAAAASQGAITILVTHRFSTIRVADRIAVLTGGRLIECATHDELIRAGGEYAELYELQARGYR